MLCEKAFIKMRRCFCSAHSNICIISVENKSAPPEVAAAEYDRYVRVISSPPFQLKADY